MLQANDSKKEAHTFHTDLQADPCVQVSFNLEIEILTHSARIKPKMPILGSCNTSIMFTMVSTDLDYNLQSIQLIDLEEELS